MTPLKAAAFLAVLLGGAATAQANLLNNGSFEGTGAGGLSSWTITSGVSVQSNAGYTGGDGSYSALLSGTDLQTISQNIFTTLGQTYTLSGFFANAGNNPASFNVTFDGQSLLGSPDSSWLNTYNQFLSISDQYGPITFLGTGSDMPISFNVYPTNAGSGIAFALDGLDVSPMAVPEPASLALLGAGLFGLGLIRRRKPA